MNFSMNKAWAFLGSRLARNIYLWVVIIYLTENNDTASRIYPARVYHFSIAVTTLILFLFTYVNNLYLIPKFLARKKRGIFFTLATVNAFACSVCYTLFIKTMATKYPGIQVHHMSLISSPITNIWTAHQVLAEIQTFVFGIFMWLLILTACWFMNDYFKQQKKMESIQKQQVESELHFLKNQINPHFLFNTLNNLYGLILKNSDKSGDAVLKLSAILRYMLYDSDIKAVPFEKEEEIMKAYIDVELLRLPAGQNVNVNIEQDKEYHVPPLLWLPVLENIFKHATRVITNQYILEYSFTIENGVLTIYSKNNYKPDANKTTAEGIGLENLRKRLALLYPGKHSIDTIQDDRFYTVQVQINLG
jgi:two-component system LytT family sensor kinase